MSSLFKVPLTKIVNILEHPHADRLEVAVVYGFQVVVRKGLYKIGDPAIYVPIDSVLPVKLEEHIFPPDSKIKLNKRRIKQIRIRKIASQGMLIKPHEILDLYGNKSLKMEEDYKELFGITKYIPPVRETKGFKSDKKSTKKKENKHFSRYNGITNIKWAPNLFQLGEEVVYQEKIHGTNARCGWVPMDANTLWRKVLKFFGLLPKWEFCYGSNNVQLQNKRGYKGYYGEDLYGKVFKELDIEECLLRGWCLYGEIYGEGIQKNYTYGCTEGHKFVLFDVKCGSYWLNPEQVAKFAKDMHLDVVPEVYRGPFLGLDHAKQFTLGASVFAPSQKVREGVVIKSANDYTNQDGSRRSLKCISEKYLDKDQTDFQ